MDSAQVREEIYAAFADLPVPNPRRLIAHSNRRDRAGEEKIRRELANKNWQDLTPGFLANRWSSFCYLSPEAYRYYLPALLIGVLREPLEDRGLTHSVVWDLRPSFWSLYYNGEDSDFRSREDIFSPAQYRAVCAFLGLMFDRLPNLHHLAAQTLHWGWNRLDTPALEAANRYYHELHNFSYPEPEDLEVAELYREIHSAFAATPYPGDDQLSGYEQGDEPAENAMELRGVKWQSAHPELLARCYTALSFLSDAGFRYFLPAFLLADLLGDALGYESNADPVFDLTRGLYDRSMNKFDLGWLSDLMKEHSAQFEATFQPLERLGITPQKALDLIKESHEKDQKRDWRAYSIRRLKPFSRGERIAIIRYLEYRAKDEYQAPEINQALERYWWPSVQSAI